jgi:nickel/cobalt exporter
MRRNLIIAGLALLVLGSGFVLLAPVMADFGRWLLVWQETLQRQLAGHLRGVAGGVPGAVWVLSGASFLYGVAHAAAPGHGKVVLGAYAGARRIAAARVAALALVAALAQGTVAVALVLVLAGLTGWGRRRIEGLESGALAGLGALLIGAVGAWLVWRAVRSWRAARCPVSTPGPAQALLAGQRAPVVYGTRDCPDCGQAHLPDPGTLARATPREALLIIAAVAVRPCSGALLVLLLTWQMGVLWAGILAAYAMALGTAALTGGLAVLVALGREGVVRGSPGLRGLGQVLEGTAGAILLLAAASVLLAGAFP